MAGVKLVAALGTGVEDESWDVLPSEVNNVLRCTFKLQHFVVSSGFQSTGFQLVADLDFLVVLAFVMKVVFEFDNQFNRFAKSVHDEFLSTEGFHLGDFEAFFLLGKFGKNVLLFSLELDLFNTGFLLFLGGKDL